MNKIDLPLLGLPNGVPLFDNDPNQSNAAYLLGLPSHYATVINGYRVCKDGLFSPHGPRLGEPLIVTAVAQHDARVAVFGIPGQMGPVLLSIKDRKPLQVAYALNILGYRAEYGRIMDVADYIIDCWGGGDGPRAILVDPTIIASIKAADAAKRDGPGPEHVSGAWIAKRRVRHRGLLPVREIPWLRDYFAVPEDKHGRDGMFRAVGRCLTRIRKQAGQPGTWEDCGVRSTALYSQSVIDAFRAYVMDHPSCLARYRR